jgi:hypothetical protein
MISMLVGIIIAILAAFRRIGAKSRNANADPVVSSADSAVSNESAPLAETKAFVWWLRGKFSTWTDQEKGSTAAVEILLPFAAVALGITALGIVLDLTRAGVV